VKEASLREEILFLGASVPCPGWKLIDDPTMQATMGVAELVQTFSCQEF